MTEHKLFLIISTLSHHTKFLVPAEDVVVAANKANEIVKELNKDCQVISVTEFSTVLLDRSRNDDYFQR